MAITAGVASLISKTDTTCNLSATAVSGAVGPVTYQWYRAQTSGFTPGGGNILAGKTSLTLADSGLLPGSTYYYILQGVDTGDSNATVSYNEVAAQTSAKATELNQFSQGVYVGMPDQSRNYNTHPCMVDVSSGNLVTGQAVKLVDSAGGVPKIIAATAPSDVIFGFIHYQPKNVEYKPGDPVEVSCAGNVLYLMATAAVARGAKVQADLTSVGGVTPAVTSGASVVGWAYDKASAPGELFRVFLATPYELGTVA